MRQFFIQPVIIEKAHQGFTIQKNITKYAQFGSMILPLKELEYKGSSADTLITYNAYTSTGAISSYREQGKPVTTLTWGWDDNYLLTQTEGSLVTQYTYDPQTLYLTRVVQPNGNYTSYTYDLMGRLSEIKDRNGKLVKKFFYNYTNK